MYNGIGLQTARGSGTNGYVQRNLSFVKTTKEKINFRSEADLLRLEAESQKGPNAAILEHARKRALELKSAEMEDVMREQGYTESEVREKVAQYRAMLMEREQNARPSTDSSHIMGRPNVRETHAVAEAQQQKNARLKEAFGISEFFVEGSSLDPDRRTKEEAARQAHIQQEERRKRRHEWVNTPSPSPTPTPSEQKDRKEKKKKKKRARDRSSSRESRKKRKSKKSKRSRSSSPKKKKRCREKKKKGKTKKKRKSCTASSSSSSSSPSASDGRKSIRRRSKKTKSSNSKGGGGGSSNKDGKVKKSFDNANKQLNSKPGSSVEEMEARRLNATSDPAREATCIDLEEEIKEIPYDVLEKLQSAKRYENQEEGTIKKAEGQTSALPQSESSELKLIESPKPTYNLNNIQMPEPSALYPPYSHNHFIPPIPTIEMNEGSVKRIDYLCPKKGTLDSSAKINLNLNNETIQDRIKGKGPFTVILTNSNDDQVNAKRDLQTCSSSFHRFANLNLSKEELLRPIHPSFSPPRAHPSFSPPSAHPSFSPPRAHPSFSPPSAQTGISMISQNGSKLREEEKSTPKNKSCITIIEVSSKMRPSRRNRSSSHSSSSSRSRSRSRSSTSLSPLRHSRSPTSQRSFHSRSRSKSKSHSVSKSRSRSRSHSRSRSRSRSRTNSHSKSRSRSRSKTRSRSRSYSHSCSKTGSRSRTRSLSAGRYSRSSMSRSRTRSRSTISRSRSRSLTRSRSRSQTKSRSRSKSKSRSPSIPRRKGSPSFLDKRRITSARKRPVPYHRPSPPPSPSSSDSESSWWSRSRSQSRSRSRSWSRTRSPSYSR